MRRSGFSRPNEDMFRRLRVGYLDIECSNLNADFGEILTWCIKPRGSSEIEFACIDRDDVLNYVGDQRVVLELLAALEGFDAIYTHYGVHFRFDFPFLNARAIKWGLHKWLPDPGKLFIFDTYMLSRKNLKLSSNRLERIRSHFGISTKKTALDGDIWNYASRGHPGALKYVLQHNRNDVIILEKVHRIFQEAKLEKIAWRIL